MLRSSMKCRVAHVVALSAGLVLAACERQPAPSADPAPSVSASGEAAPTGPKVYEHEVLSQVYEVDRLYKSMQGPSSVQRVALAPKERELLWIVGFEAQMVDPEGTAPISQEFMCHTNLDMDVEKHQAAFGDDKRITGRLFTLSQGQYRIDLPEGFGIPIGSDELLDVNTQVLNLNRKDGKRSVRHRVVMRYVRDRDVTRPMQALFVAGAYGMKLLDGRDGHYGVDTTAPDHSHHMADQGGCLPGANAGDHTVDDGKGRVFTGHWVVKPGREENHTRVTDVMDLPFDTRAHYVATHLHPFAESLELRDLTTGKTVYRAGTRQADQGIGLAHVDFYTSVEGLPLFKDHEYEVVSIYNNTSDQDQDSMAVLNLYLVDHAFRKPDLSKAARPAGSTPPAGSAPPQGSTAPAGSGTSKAAPGSMM